MERIGTASISLEVSARWSVLSQREMKVIFLLSVLFCVVSSVPVILDAASLLETGVCWMILENLENDVAEDLCSASPTQTFWQSMEVSVSSLSQWAEHFATNDRPSSVPQLLPLFFCTALNNSDGFVAFHWEKPKCVLGKDYFLMDTNIRLQMHANENAMYIRAGDGLWGCHC